MNTAITSSTLALVICLALFSTQAQAGPFDNLGKKLNNMLTNKVEMKVEDTAEDSLDEALDGGDTSAPQATSTGNTGTASEKIQKAAGTSSAGHTKEPFTPYDRFVFLAKNVARYDALVRYCMGNKDPSLRAATIELDQVSMKNSQTGPRYDAVKTYDETYKGQISSYNSFQGKTAENVCREGWREKAYKRRVVPYAKNHTRFEQP